MKRISYLLILIAVSAFLMGITIRLTNVQEADGTPSVGDVRTFVVPNDSLADDGSNQVTLSYSTSADIATHAALSNVHQGTQTVCATIYAPNTEVQITDDIESWFRAPVALTIVEMWCESDGSMNIDFQIDGGTPADVSGSDIVCDADGDIDNTDLTGSMADGDRLDLAIASSSAAVTRLSFCAEYTLD